MQKSPLASVQEKFGDKAKLVEALEKFTKDDLWVNRTNKDKGLAHVSNAKLLRLHRTFTEVKEKFGTRDKLVDAVLGLMKRTKDAGMRTRLAAYPVPRLLDLYKSWSKKAGPKAEPKKAAAPKDAKKGEKGTKPAKATAKAKKA